MAFNSILRNKSSSFLRAFASSAKLIRKTQPGHREVLSTAVNRFVPRFHFSSVAVKNNPSSVDENLLRDIEEQITCEHETEKYGPPVAKVPSDFPFKIIDKTGQQTITLERTYEGEEIKVVVDMPDFFTGEEQDNNDNDADTDNDNDNDNDKDKDNDNDNESERATQSSFPISVSVSKKGEPSLNFRCMAYPDEIVIDSLSVKNPDVSDDQIPYEGPDFQSLDESLQKTFQRYLEIRGIKPSTTNFLHAYMNHKESKEYLVWLNMVKNFIEA